MLAHDYPVTLACELLGLARSTYYYEGQERDETAVEVAIKAVVAEWPTYGYRRLTAQLQREGWEINHKRVRRLMQELDLSLPVKRKKRRTTNSEHGFPRYPNLVQDLVVVRPDQVWVSDITYIRLHTEFIYLAVIMDVFTRSIRGWQLGHSLDQTLTLRALQRALVHHPAPEMHHSDQGGDNTPPRLTRSCSRKPRCKSAWLRSGRPGRTVMPSDSSAPSKRMKLTWQSIKTIMMRAASWGGSWMMSMLTSGFTPRWVISRPPSLKRNGGPSSPKRWLIN